MAAQPQHVAQSVDCVRVELHQQTDRERRKQGDSLFYLSNSALNLESTTALVTSSYAYSWRNGKTEQTPLAL